MSEVNDTVAPEATETEPSVDNGTAIEPSQESVESTETKEETVAREVYEQLQKELNKTKQELNLRRNQEKELEKKSLEEQGKHKELAEKLQAELDEIRTKEEESTRAKEANDFRENILKEYPADVKEAAEGLNLWWDEPKDFAEAESQLRAKLDVLNGKIGTKTAPVDEDTAPEISANNPITDTRNETELEKLKTMSAAELRKILPKAPSR